MKNTRFEPYNGPRMSRDTAIRRLKNVIQKELTPIQQQIFLAYYIQEKTMEQIARERGIHKSSVCRTLHRAEKTLQKYLRY